MSDCPWCKGLRYRWVGVATYPYQYLVHCGMCHFARQISQQPLIRYLRELLR